MKFIKAAALLAPLMVLAGCAGSGPAAPQYLPTHINIPDTELDSQLTRLPVTVDVDPSGFMSVTVPLRSEADFILKVDYRFTFLDAKGLPINAEPAWMPMALEPGVVENLVGTCPVPGATDFSVDVRPEQ
jgi:uncharacterized protein YcfL